MATTTDAHHGNPPDPLPARTGGRRDHTAVLVVGLDGSPTSWDAFSWACGEAQRLQGRLVAVFVTPETLGAAAGAAALGVPVCDYTVIQNAAAEQAAQLQAEAHQSAAAHNLPLGFIHARGDTATELLRIAHTLHADQIVVGKSTKLHHRLNGALGRRLMTKRAAPIVVIVP